MTCILELYINLFHFRNKMPRGKEEHIVVAEIHEAPKNKDEKSDKGKSTTSSKDQAKKQRRSDDNKQQNSQESRHSSTKEAPISRKDM